MRLIKCVKCGAELPATEFPANRRIEGGRLPTCRTCHKDDLRKFERMTMHPKSPRYLKKLYKLGRRTA